MDDVTADIAAFLLACLDTDEQVEMNAPTAATYKRSFRLADIAAKKTIVEELAVLLGSQLDPVRNVARHMLWHLAQPYRGRPGWSDEWNIT